MKQILFNAKRLLKHAFVSTTEEGSIDKYSNLRCYKETRAVLIEMERKKAAAQLEKLRHSIL